jgi:CheY-like chemotaxis protein
VDAASYHTAQVRQNTYVALKSNRLYAAARRRYVALEVGFQLPLWAVEKSQAKWQCSDIMNTLANKSIAIIDDDESLCRSLARLLAVAGFQPITFHSAEAFLADPMRPHFACVLVDLQLTGMSGLEMHQKLLAQGSRTPVVFITAYDDPEARTAALQSGCAGFFRKTDPGAKIIETLRRIALGEITP